MRIELCKKYNSWIKLQQWHTLFMFSCIPNVSAFIITNEAYFKHCWLAPASQLISTPTPMSSAFYCNSKSTITINCSS